MTQKPSLSLKHIAELDGIRGLAVLMVIAGHGGIKLPGFDLGRSGVVIFFVLSGYLISGILIDRRSTPGYFKNFWGRRILRIFPLYYAILALLFFVLPFILPASMEAYHNEVGNQLWYWTYMQNYHFSLHGFPDFDSMSHLWSLAVEEQFYMFWPFVVAFVPPRHLKTVCLLLIAVGFGSRGLNYAMGLNWAWSYVPLWSSVDSLALGALLAIAMRANRLLPSHAKLISGLTVALFIAGACLNIGIYHTNWADQQHANFILERSVVTPIGAGLIILALILGDGSRYRRFLRHPFLLFCGKYSYAMYIFHPYLNILLSKVEDRLWQMVHVPNAVQIVVHVALSLSAAILASVVSWYILEKPCLSLKRYFSYGSKPAEAV